MRISHQLVVGLTAGVLSWQTVHSACGQGLEGVVFVDDIETAAAQQSQGPSLPMLRGTAPTSVPRTMLSAPPAEAAQQQERGLGLPNPFAWLNRDDQAAPPQQPELANNGAMYDPAVKPASAAMRTRPGRGFQTRDTRNEKPQGIFSGWGNSSQQKQQQRVSSQQPSASRRTAVATNTQTAPRAMSTQPAARPLAAARTAPVTGNQRNMPLAMPLPTSEPVEPADVAWVDDSTSEPAGEAVMAQSPKVTAPATMPSLGLNQPRAMANPHAMGTSKPAAKTASQPKAPANRQVSANQPASTKPAVKIAAVENPVMPTPTSDAAPSPRAASLLVEANSIAQNASTEEEFSQVIQMCRHVLAIDGTPSAISYSKNLASWALNRRGELKADSGRESEASLDFDDAIRFDTACWRAIHNRGVLKAQQGDFAGAMADFKQTIDINPKFAKAYSNRAALAVQEGDLEGACDDYHQAIQLDPDLAIAHKGRGRVCHLLGQFDVALQHLDAAAMLAPTDPNIANSRADLLMDMGRYHEALEGYKTAVSLDANMAESHRNLAWLLSTCPASDCRNAQQALASIERAVALTGADDDLTLDTLAAAKANAGDFVAAVETQQRAIDLADADSKPVYESRLKLYQQQQPYRTEPASSVQQATFVE